MSEKRPRTCVNHARIVPLFHYVVLPRLALNLLLALAGLLDALTIEALNRAGVAVALALVALFPA